MDFDYRTRLLRGVKLREQFYFMFFVEFHFTRAGGASGVMREIILTSRGEIKVIDFQGRDEARKEKIKREA